MAIHYSRGVRFHDIRGDKSSLSLLAMLKESLNPTDKSPRTFPTLLLYDEKGLKLFEDITYLDEYYLTNAEIQALEAHADEIVERIPRGTRLVELGSGNLRKVNIMLRAFEAAKKEVDYYALDLSLPELERTFAELDTDDYHYVSFNALHGTYDDALQWLTASNGKGQTTCLLTMGSSLGNFERDSASKFLAGFKKVLHPSDLILVGLDSCQQPQRVYHAYNDSQAVTEKFYRNGLTHANSLLGYEAFKRDEWRPEGRYDQKLARHHASYVALTDVVNKDFSFKKGESVPFEDAFKYSSTQCEELWRASGLVPQAAYGNKEGDYFIHLLCPAVVEFPLDPKEYASGPVPALSDWQQLWSAWDIVTKSMIPTDELLKKPIKLRNDLIFYLGHIPTFADIHFTKATDGKPTHPASFWSIFERGIDPDVDDPTLCHDHSEIPDTWPPLPDILSYAARVRSRITESLVSGRAIEDRRLGRGLWLAYEHEAMHLETFLYMLIQSERILPPPGTGRPDFKALADQARGRRVANKWHQIPAQNIKLGLDDAENYDGPDRFFGWDNEKPSRTVSVKAFEAQSRPISNGEYAHFLEATHKNTVPASWISGYQSTLYTNGVNGSSSATNGSLAVASASYLEDKAIRTVYGPIPLKYTLDWPVMASYDELAAYARWSNGRIPTLEEARSIYSYVDSTKGALEQNPSKLISAVNGHLSNNGVEETPPPNPLSPATAVNGRASTLNPNDLFVPLHSHAVAFTTWHPEPVTGSTRLRGQSDAGGLWEWTSTPLAAHEGFKAMDLYPGYTADFFDGKHNVCLGGSWATAPRISGRKSFVNWYQRNYPYVWCTARLVRDAQA
ncbi:uncharacterized protein A1O9_08509 [Exophiala aquamarina CBS 119918]|uniref:Uncharacterized protein n=1 Tax=Exophiala aquamarina CBS 119918 TaxID=1182545 RepID=A0A072P932_9EURO|nr:uncharacterized protein A1O9_08509 [Exophiala aquamarina CBS 119918]KEF55758.1 hypothetical protein A1O9_08509 [Exophiala aquamarina CBS 119918]